MCARKATCSVLIEVIHDDDLTLIAQGGYSIPVLDHVEDGKRYFMAQDDALGIHEIADSLESLKALIEESIAFSYRFYVMKKGLKLTAKAQRLRDVLAVIFHPHESDNEEKKSRVRASEKRVSGKRLQAS